uniref:LTD domain-containing protein n=1 Tax=Naja naja TaxID=35670 RepID=A0A8C6XM68_NAJNA
MGSVLICVSVLLLCFWLREGNSQNLIQDQKRKPTLLINEVNADNPGDDTMEYLELYHVSGRRVALKGYHLVLYNGKGNTAYKVLPLGDFSTDDQGFLLVGSGNLVPRPAKILPKGTIQNGPDAIALYFGRSELYEGMPVDNKGLEDALVHKSNKRDKADELVRVLTPGTEPFLEDPFFRITDDESLERCQGMDSQRFFQVGAPTPGADNHCIPFSQLNASVVLINEVKWASSPGDAEFVELQATPSVEVKDLVMVLMEGRTQKIYSVMEVKGETSPDGLLLLGSGLSKIPGGAAHFQNFTFLQNSSTPLLKAGTNAIALYSGSISQFVVGSSVTSTPEILDALVYTTVEQPDSELLDSLTPGKPLFYVSRQSQADGASVSRCFCCSVSRDASSYALAKPTPLQFNDCPKMRFSQKVSFCFQVAGCHQKPQDEGRIQRVLAQSLEKRCNCSFSPAYFKDPVLTCEGRELVFTALLSARSTEQLDRELQALSIFEKSKEWLHFGNQNHSIATKTCSSNADRTDAPPDVTSEEPRTTGEPPTSPLWLLINEVNADNPGSREDMEYIELFYPGQAPFSLENYWLVLYNGKNNLAYQVLNLTGYSTNEWGYFLVGSGGVTPKPSLLLPEYTIQNGVDAVALYHNANPNYKINMQVTVDGLVDAVVYRARGSDRADKLMALLTPGQNVLHENDSHSTEDESISRCLSLKPRDPKSFQVTEITPLRENSCMSFNLTLTKEVIHNSLAIINEVGLANDSFLYKFIELKGKPGDSLKKYTLHFFSGSHNRPYNSIHLQGKFGNDGLFVLRPGRPSESDKPNEQLVMPSLWNHPFPKHEILTIALFSRKVRLPYGTLNLAEKLEYSLVWNPGTISQMLSTPGKRERIWSSSYCPFCKETFLISNPTPGMENSCPQESLSLDFRMCLWTPNCSFWLQNPQLRAHFQQTLVRSMEDSCLCAISLCALQELNFTCSDTILKLSGRMLTTSPEQQQLLIQWQQNFSLSSHPFSVDGIFLRTNAPCTPSSEVVPISKASFQAWKIALLILGSISFILLLIGGTVYCIKRPQNYNNIELNDRCEIISAI